MHKNPFPFFLILLFAFSACKKEETATYCQEAIDSTISEVYDGRLVMCNFSGTANNPPLTIDATATLTAHTSTYIDYRIVTDSALVDTTVRFTYSCTVVEETIPIIYLSNPNGDGEGQRNGESGQPGRTTLLYGDNCPEGSFFEGYAQ